MDPIIQTIIPGTAGIVVALAIGAIAWGYQYAVQLLPANISTQLKDIAETAVQAIEQKYKNQPASAISAPANTNAAKKKEALTIIEEICTELRIPFNENHADAAIEAAVYAMNLFKK